jgi:dTDP-4-dehydrorhamnose reductase
MMGGGVKKDKKFINKIYQKIKAGEKVLYVVDDKLGSPTYTYNFAAGIKAVLEKELWGVYNQVGMGSGSRYDVAVELVRLMGLDKEIEIKKVDSTYFKEQFFVPRPTSERLINAKLSNRGVNQMRNWRECLSEYVQDYIKDYEMVKKAGKAGGQKEKVNTSSTSSGEH